MRATVLEVIRLDYVNTARAKGLSERITVLEARRSARPDPGGDARRAPGPDGSSAARSLTEQIFRVPGIGSLLMSSILANDTPVIMAITFVFSCLVVLSNLLAGSCSTAGSIPRISLPLAMARDGVRLRGGRPPRSAPARPARRRTSLWREAWRRFRRHRLAMFGAVGPR